MIRFPSFRPTPSCNTAKTAQESLADILAKATRPPARNTKDRGRGRSSGQSYTTTTAVARTMPSSKGTPTDPELREEVKEEVKAEEKGGGKGSWSAWKAGEMARRYEDRGGDYEDNGSNTNKAQKGAPEKK